MNIFYLHRLPSLAAAYHCDKHIVKMIVEYAQLLSTAHRVLDGERRQVMKQTKTGRTRRAWVYVLPDEREDVLYKATHVNHPSAVWVRQSNTNYLWLSALLECCLIEYRERYGKVHKVERVGLNVALQAPPLSIVIGGRTPMPQAMPEEYQTSNAVEAYRAFYNGAKSRFAKWRNGNVPEWFNHP